MSLVSRKVTPSSSARELTTRRRMCLIYFRAMQLNAALGRVHFEQKRELQLTRR